MEVWIAALSLGFLGSFHCVGMCGPIALALPVRSSNKLVRMGGALIYNSGRTFTYAIFGGMFGLLGKGFVIGGYQQALSIALGVIILVGLLMPKSWTSIFSMLPIVNPFVSKLKSALGYLFSLGSLPSLFSIGMLNGLLPCGLVYMAVAGAIATGDMWRGSLFMAVFGWGTVPAMMLVTMAVGAFNLQWRSRIRQAVPVFVGLMACVLILRGLNLGIPYLSPELSKTDCTKQTCCSKK